MPSYTPRDYQLKGIEWLLQNQTTGLLQRPGLGKTSQVLAYRSILKDRGMCRGVLVIAPIRVAYLVWPAELVKWDDFSNLSITILHGPDKDKRLREKHDIYVINPEGLDWLFGELLLHWQSEHDWPFRDLIIDESSKFKNRSSKRFRLMKCMVGKFMRRVILTGSPMPRSYVDLWAQFYLIDDGATLGHFVTKYLDKYFVRDADTNDYILKDGAEHEIQAKLRGKALVMLEKDYLKLPPLSFVDVRVDLPDDARKIYNDMLFKLKADVQAGKVTAANAAVAIGKCRQIANGAVILDQTGAYETIHTAKIDALTDLVDELEGAKALIAYTYNSDVERLQDALKDFNTRTMRGGMSMEETGAIERLWNAGALDHVLCQPQAMGHGLNMQGAGQAVIFFSLTYNYDDYDQLICRLYRQGVQNPVIVYRIIANNTVDEVMLDVLNGRGNSQSAFFDALKNYLDE